MAAKNAFLLPVPFIADCFTARKLIDLGPKPYVSILKPEKTVRTPHIQSDN